MNELRSSAAIVLVLTFLFRICHGQETPAVNWNFEAWQSSKHEFVVSITANVAPGWHLYSQHLKEGGPQPTRVRFSPSDNYAPVGQVIEKGDLKKFYDDIYEMEIAWYAGRVTFFQKFRIHESATSITGKVEYMTCNNQICIPDMTEFSIDVDPLSQTP